MLQETFGGRLFGDPSVGFGQFSDEQKANAALVGAAFVGLFSLFNIAGRFFWASLSDTLGRKATYFTFFTLGFLLYAAVPFAAKGGVVFLFVLLFAVVITMYGGGFATIPAYLADIFGTHYVGAIHGRLLTAWSTAGVLGPVLVNYIREYQLSIGVPREAAYNQTMYVLAGLLLAGLACNLLVRPVDEKYYMSDAEVAAAKKTSVAAVQQEEKEPHADFEDYVEDALEPSDDPVAAAPARSKAPGLSPILLLSWAAVGIPLAWGVSMTVLKAMALFQ
jgi:MFS family permease